ncbi:chemotaxis protein [Pseudomonas cerasi]|nr:chemotaxis protein [Pseudomonas cerasi]SOS21573.1 chemotaxis protein [Pseudomonas cerasi]
MPAIYPNPLETLIAKFSEGLIRTLFLIGRPDGPFYSGVKMDPTDLGPGTATWLGGTGTILLGGFLWLRKFLSRDATDRAMDNADIGTVRRLNELLDSERIARKEAEARADQFAKERNELAAAVGRMEGRIDALTSQVAQLTDKVTSQSSEISRLRTQLGGNS